MKNIENYLLNQIIGKQLAKCQFTTEYWDHERRIPVNYECSEDNEILESGLCILHDKNYLQDQVHHEDQEQKVIQKLKDIVSDSIFYDKPLLCIGCYLPNIDFNQFHFDKPVYCSQSKFIGRANFAQCIFQQKVSFADVTF